MDKSPIRDNVTTIITTALTKYAAGKVNDGDPGEILSDKESQLLAERVLSKLGIDNRIKLYVDVFCSEIETLALQIGEEAVSDKVKKAIRKG